MPQLFLTSLTLARAIATGPTLKTLRNPREDRAPLRELRRGDADPRAISQLIFAVGEIDDVEARHHLAQALSHEIMLDAGIDLHVIRLALGVGKARSQPRARDQIGREQGVER